MLLAYLLSAYGTVRGMAGTVEEYVAHSVEAMRLAERTNPVLALELRVSAAYPHYLVGRLHDALGLIDSYLESAGDGPRLGFNAFNIGLFAVWFRAMLLHELGRIADGIRQLEQAERVAREHGESEILGWVHFAHVMNAGLTGGVESALAHARQCLEIALRIGSAFSRTVAYRALGYAHLLRGEWSESVRATDEALAIARERRTGVEAEAAALATLAEAQLGAGDHLRARILADEAVAAASRRGTTLFEPQVQFTLARVLLRAEGARARGAIEAALERAHAVSTKIGARVHGPFIHLERAELARLTGDAAADVRELREAQRLFAEMGATVRAEQVARALA